MCFVIVVEFKLGSQLVNVNICGLWRVSKGNIVYVFYCIIYLFDRIIDINNKNILYCIRFYSILFLVFF